MNFLFCTLRTRLKMSVPYLRVLSYNHSLSKAPKLWHFQCNRIVNNVNQIT